MTEQRGKKSDFNNGGGGFRETNGSNRQQDTNFNSSKLNSERIVSITNGEPIKTIWKNILKKHPLNQSDIRILVNSALVAMDYQSEVGELVKELGNPESGLKRLREIIKFPSMSCDAGLDGRVLSFQYVILPLLGLLNRTAISGRNLKECVRAIFMVVYTNLDSFLYHNVMKMLETLVQRNSIVDNKVSVKELLSRGQHSFIPSSLGIFFLVIIRFLAELLHQIDEASINETMHKIVHNLQRLKTAYLEQQQTTSALTDPLIYDLETRKNFFMILEKELKNMNEMLIIHDLPGELSKNGRRHDNDFKEISKISIIPTKEEILCDRSPFLPSSNPDAPHFLPEGIARLLDTQFRLLREDMLNPIRSSLLNFLSGSKKIGGKFKCDSGDLQVYTGVKFIHTDRDRKKGDRKKGLACTITLRDANNKLLTGNLVVLLLPNQHPMNHSDFYSVYFGVITKILHNEIDINFDLSIYHNIVLHESSNPDNEAEESLRNRFLIESSNIYFEAYYHFLKNLQTTNPINFPFEKYLAPNSDYLKMQEDKKGKGNIKVESPMYTKAPGFQFDLSVLCNNKQSLKLNVADTRTHNKVVNNIKKHSIISKPGNSDEYGLDETQAKALVYALTREIALIEGPPGTGKTVIGVQVIKVLLANNNITNSGPILTICFTNHALDQFLEDLLDQDITSNIIRLGTRTKSEKIKKFNLEEISKKKLTNHSKYLIAMIHTTLEEIEGDIKNVKEELSSSIKKTMNWDDIREYLMNEESEYYVKFNFALHNGLPNWIFEEIEEDAQNKQSDLPRQVSEGAQNKQSDLSRRVSKGAQNKQSVLPRQVSKDAQNKQSVLPRQVSKDAQNKQNNDIKETDDEFSDEEELKEESIEEESDEEFEDEEFDEEFENEESNEEELEDEESNEEEFEDEESNEEELEDEESNEEEFEDEESDEEFEDEESNEVEFEDESDEEFEDEESNEVEFEDEEPDEEFEDEELEDEFEEEESKGEEFKDEFEKEEFKKRSIEEICQPQSSLFSEITNRAEEPFQTVGNKRKMNLFEQWLKGDDVRIIKQEKKKYQEDSNDDELQWIRSYEEPNTDRHLGILLKEYSIWQMSKVERRKLHDYWRTKINNKFIEMLSKLQKMHEKKNQEINDIYDEARHEVLLNSDVIGMTTTGAAKFQTLIKSIGPKIIICEEAGEVLEAHILSALTTSTQHLILIGDHNQLRPHIATYSLSIDSPMGNYQLDKSLFERLVHGDNAVKIEKSQLLTQRRMRKEISDLIRIDELYPKLIDGDNTTKYPNVRGAQHNVYFIDHEHPEDADGKKTHVNNYEVKMVVEMVKYFVKNGYTKPEDIAVLTPYLEQMSEIKLKLNQQITLRTVDNFQGEEANIVIISLVRNFSGSGRHGSIGFLKSINRSNVLLSRAREGMYLIGNSKLMAAKSKDMWAPVIDILKERKQVDFGMPIVCNRHPDYKNTITEPEQFAQVSPNGGCNQQCGILLSCGHACTHKCHSDDSRHIRYKCLERCSKSHPGCNHPCLKLCSDICGRCNEPVGDIKLPDCGHTLQNAKCWQNKTKDTLKCIKIVTKKLPRCEHSKDIFCYEPIDKVKCRRECGKILECDHECLDECYDCPKHSTLGRSNKPPSRCNFSVGDIILPNCGHTLQNAKCWQNQSIEKLDCMVLVTITLPRCRHPKVLHCFKPVYEAVCGEKCGKILECGHECSDKCFNCLKHSLQGSSMTNRCNASIDIILSGCGHKFQDAKCWQNQAQETLKCMTLVKRKLPHCEHSKFLHCSKSVDDAKCSEKCGKILECGHECLNECSKCPTHSILKGKSKSKPPSLCNYSVGDITLSDCGHTFQDAKCWQNQDQKKIKCMTQVTKKLPNCKHSKSIHCCKSVDNVKCKEKCSENLDCGHKCLDECFKCPKHSTLQKVSKKPSICNFPVGDIILSSCGHKFQDAKCWQNQAQEKIKCMLQVTKKLPNCEHTKSIHCYESVDKVKCTEKCGKTLKCDHECLNECSKCPIHSTLKGKSKSKPSLCNYSVGDIILPRCNHVLQNAKCWQNQTKGTVKCMIQATKKLPHCEHSNLIHCYESVNDVYNTKCKEKCGKILECGHKCNQNCHKKTECPPCKSKCTISCRHTTAPCNKSCSVPCSVCARKCSWECKHQGKCELNCGTPCYRLPCNERCGKKLNCGHKCMGICGEICPTKEFCVICASKNVKNQVSDMSNNTIFSKVNWDKERMIVLNCGHVYTMETMDIIMEMEYYYEGSTKGGWTSIKPLPTSITSMKTCPECQTPIKDIRRYGRIIKKYILDAQIEKFRLKYDKQFKGIKKQIVFKVSKNRKVQLKNYLPIKSKTKKTFNFIPEHYFENIEKYRGDSRKNEQIWIKYIKKLLKHHEELKEISCATETPPHKKAFDASALTLHQAKLARFDPSEYLQLNFQETQEALSRVGISIPQIDRRIYLDINFEIINVQKVIFDEILFIIQKISKDSTSNDLINIKGGWSKLAESIQNSIQQNLVNMRKVAESCHYYRDLLLIGAETLEFDLETLKLQLTKANGIFVRAKIIEKCGEIKKNIENIIRSDRYNTVEKNFRCYIHKRLENLSIDCDGVVNHTNQGTKSFSSIV